MQGRHYVRPWAAHVGVELKRAVQIIGIDGSRATVGTRTGTERYSVELLSALADLCPPEEIRVYLDAADHPPELRLPGTAIPIPGPHFWTLRNLATEMRRHPPDILFVPSHVIPPVHPKSVVTIHDLGYLIEPDSHQPIHRKQLEWTTRWNAKAATGLIAVSEATKCDLVNCLHVAPDRIQVIHHGVGEEFARAPDSEIAAIREKYRIGSMAILAVGTLQPRKNLTRLIQAFEQLAPRYPAAQLVLSGAPGWRSDKILHRATVSPFRARIRHLGYVPESDLPALYSSAGVLAFPSLYEGFGLPALEAMACGTPIVAANRSSLPEVCGDAAVLVDPLDTVSIANAIELLLTNEAFRQELIARGFARASKFRWHECAAQTLAFLRSIGDNERRARSRDSE
jgi:glycosyltransferase involved in cell wall biosynthesis